VFSGSRFYRASEKFWVIIPIEWGFSLMHSFLRRGRGAEMVTLSLRGAVDLIYEIPLFGILILLL
jgi:hypothetical protein